MASDVAGSATPTTGAESATFTLQIISPSIGIPQPLALQRLPTDTTVKQLKERIRNVISTRPTDEAQRLIHRGRLLGRDNETMTEIFGQETLRSTEHQSLHLVLRDLSDGRPTSTSTPLHATNQTSTPAQPAAPGAHNLPQHHPHHAHLHHTNPFQPQPLVRVGVPHFHGAAFGLPQGGIPGIPNAQPTNPLPHMTPQQPYNPWTRAMNTHLAALNQNQRTATPGAPDMATPNFRGTPGTTTPGRTASPFQPENTRTTVREGVGPNGLQWRVTYNETFINPLQRPGRTGSPFPTADATSQPRSIPNGGQLSGNEVQSILRAADTGSATRVMADAMRRNASSSSLANLAAGQAHHPIPPGVTTPLIPSRADSGTATPDPLRAAGRTRSPATNQTQAQPSQGTPEVYILSSPSGPRALLLNTGLETYFSPARVANQPLSMPFGQRPFPPQFLPQFPPQLPPQLGTQYFMPTPTIQPQVPQNGRPPMANPQANHIPHPQQPAQPQHGLPQPPQHQHQPQPQLGHAMARADNPQVQAIRIAQLWPNIWMIIRLGLFIWWFTSPTFSWSRWITVISVAVTFFLINTGLLNPLADQIWVPFRRHLENLIPLADGHQQGAQAPARPGNARNGNGDAAADPGQQRDPNPADAAARLVQQRRNANANWLMDQARRLERAGILFLASIAPGVAERHIAQMEAEARAERRRREAEAEAAAAAVEQSERPEGSGGAEQNAGESGEQNQVPEGERNHEQPPAAEEPLIAV
ncbi:hypothetical protein F4804DRAFT_342756 [Jackrogersella minutella]|nr:hypothetical protein F4804DRAFT_342756 [Jackrogersella minutella]